MSEIRFIIDGHDVSGKSGQTILDVAKKHNIPIPTLCHDERVKVYGGCGLCVVEAKGNPKLLRACATTISPGMEIYTKTDRVEANRKIALELLLTDHTGDCLAPCIRACPAHTDCQGYVGLIANGEFRESLKLIKEQLPLPASIGRVCPHPCEDECRRQLKEEPVAIAWHKRFVADLDLSDQEPFMPDLKPATGKRVAIVGGGPGGLSAAYYLLMEGHSVVIYDMMPSMGGMLRYGIPQYRLPKEVLEHEIQLIQEMGAIMKNCVRIGKDITLDTLRSTYDAIYLSIGCWNSTLMRCVGEELDGVIGGIDFLRDVALGKNTSIGKRVAVIGGGNTAMDACRTAIRLGADQVFTIYRRTREEMPAEDIEITEAEEEGIEFKYLVNPLEILDTDGKVSAIRLQKMKLGEPDSSGRRRPVPIEGAQEILEIDKVIIAIGQSVNLSGFEELQQTTYGTISTDTSRFTTNLPGVFAGGDAINDNLKIAIQAIADGKNASRIIDGYLNGIDLVHTDPYLVIRDDVNKDEFSDTPLQYRPKMGHLKPSYRKNNFEEVVLGFSPESAIEDAKRCLECGCHDFFECTLIRYSQEYKVSPQPLHGEKHNRKVDNSHPFILRNPDKCILCGLCVRACNELMDITALGLVDRGFDAIVKPAMDRPLKETDCISCGQCVSVCPTGALQEKLLLEKSVPLKSSRIRTTCGFCSIGCQMDLEYTGEKLVRALPVENSPVDNGLLCVKGRFGFDSAVMKNRLKTPLVRKDGQLVTTTWEEAIRTISERLKETVSHHTSQSIGVCVSAGWTNEEIYGVKHFASQELETTRLYSLNQKNCSLADVFGLDASPNTLDELSSTDLIILVGSLVMRDHPIAGLKIKEAVKEHHTSLITVNPGASKADEWSSLAFHPTNNLDFLRQITAALLKMKEPPNNVVGYADFKASFNQTEISANAKTIAKHYAEARKAMIVFDQSAITGEAVQLIACISLLAGHIGKYGQGIVQLKPQNNSQGIALMNIRGTRQLMETDIQEHKIKSLLLLGENYESDLLENLDFLVVADTHLTYAAQKADVVLPAASFAESNGTIVSTDRRILKVQAARSPAAGFDHLQILSALSEAMDSSLSEYTSEALRVAIEKTEEGFLGINALFHHNDCNSYWPISENIVLYLDGFHTKDKRANLVIPSDALLFEELPTSDHKTDSFIHYLKEEGLDRI
jgi:formate dehydrogenase major subunit